MRPRPKSSECDLLQSGECWQHGRNFIEMRGRRFALLRIYVVVYIDLQAAYMIGDVGVLGDDLGEFACPPSQTSWIHDTDVIVEGDFGIDVAFNEFGEEGVALSAFLEGNQIRSKESQDVIHKFIGKRHWSSSKAPPSLMFEKGKLFVVQTRVALGQFLKSNMPKTLYCLGLQVVVIFQPESESHTSAMAVVGQLFLKILQQRNKIRGESGPLSSRRFN